MKKLTKKERAELFCKVDSEGFDYYMLQYGPDLEAIERLGFDIEEVEKAILLFSTIQEEINKGEQFLDLLED